MPNRAARREAITRPRTERTKETREKGVQHGQQPHDPESDACPYTQYHSRDHTPYPWYGAKHTDAEPEPQIGGSVTRPWKVVMQREGIPDRIAYVEEVGNRIEFLNGDWRNPSHDMYDYVAIDPVTRTLTARYTETIRRGVEPSD